MLDGQNVLSPHACCRRGRYYAWHKAMLAVVCILRTGGDDKSIIKSLLFSTLISIFAAIKPDNRM